jgi:uncharacterized NAD(P)/FAD-binding protein YdhS
LPIAAAHPGSVPKEPERGLPVEPSEEVLPSVLERVPLDVVAIHLAVAVFPLVEVVSRAVAEASCLADAAASSREAAEDREGAVEEESP